MWKRNKPFTVLVATRITQLAADKVKEILEEEDITVAMYVRRVIEQDLVLREMKREPLN